MEAPRDGIIIQYCCLVGFFALTSQEQRAFISNAVEPFYASFNDGDGMYTRPLMVLFGNLRDAYFIVTNHLGEPGYMFVSEKLNDALGDALAALYPRWCGEEEWFDTQKLDEPEWSALRIAASDV